MTLRRIMTDEDAEYEILRLMTPDTKKFGIAIGYVFDLQRQQALERLMLRNWIRLIDVTTTRVSQGQVMRIFRVMPEAVAWFERRMAP